MQHAVARTRCMQQRVACNTQHTTMQRTNRRWPLAIGGGRRQRAQQSRSALRRRGWRNVQARSAGCGARSRRRRPASASCGSAAAARRSACRSASRAPRTHCCWCVRAPRHGMVATQHSAVATHGRMLRALLVLAECGAGCDDVAQRCARAQAVDVLCAIDTLRLAATAFEVRVGHRWVFEADRRTILLRSARAIRLGLTPLPHPHRDLGPPLPHLHPDWAASWYRAMRAVGMDTVPARPPRPCSRLRAPRHRRAANKHEGARVVPQG